MPYLLFIVVLVLFAVAWVGIFRRLGWSPWWGILMVVPLSFLVTTLVLWLQRWPIERRVAELEAEVARLQGRPIGPGFE
jgi:peptidoglycan/LPS O-acetylase OafA/YrhL